MRGIPVARCDQKKVHFLLEPQCISLPGIGRHSSQRLQLNRSPNLISNFAFSKVISRHFQPLEIDTNFLNKTATHNKVFNFYSDALKRFFHIKLPTHTKRIRSLGNSVPILSCHFNATIFQNTRMKSIASDAFVMEMIYEQPFKQNDFILSAHII